MISIKDLYLKHKKTIFLGVIGSVIATGIYNMSIWAINVPYDDKYVAVVLARKQIDFGIPAEFQKGFDSGSTNKGQFFETKDGNKVRIRAMEDFGSIDEAKRIAIELINDKNCILVIGNSNSTVTATALDVFLANDDPPSYILPIATATNLLSKAKTGGHDAILRMVPDNASQAIQIQRLAGRLFSKPRVAIYGDQENPLYSKDLMRDVASRIRSKGGSIIIEEMIGPTNSIFNSLIVWEKAPPPELIIYVGVAHHGLLLVDQIKELGIEAPIIFTDGSMVEAVIQNISRIKNSAYVLSPVATKSEPNKYPTYEPIGADAYTLTRRLIGSCQNCNRENMRLEIKAAKSTSTYLSNGKAGEYQFNSEGNNTGMDYKVYEITGGQISLFIDY